MAKVKSAGNKTTELRLIEILRANRISGWRRGSKLPGRPDFVFPKLKTAVFVDGCFWHGCPKHATWPKTREAFWLAKILGNKARDRRANRLLRAKGWKVIRIWEHALKKQGAPRLLKRLALLASISAKRH